MKPLLRTDGAAWVVLAALLCTGAVVVTATSADAGAALTAALDWQARLGLREPWRLWTAAWVHWSAAHLAINVVGAIVVAFVGWRARLPPAAATAWFAAWPLTQVAMAALGSERVAAAMPHYGGLSGVLHAGAIVLGLSLAWPAGRAGAPLRVTPGPGDPAFVATQASTLEPSRITEGPWAMTEMGVTGAMPLSALEPPPRRRGPPVAERPLRERWIGVAIVAGTVLKVLLEAPWDLAPRLAPALGIAVAPVAHACGIAAGVLAWAGGWAWGRRNG